MNLIAAAVRRWQVTLVAFMLLALLGYNAFRQIPRAVDPYFPIPGVVVIATLPGADAAGTLLGMIGVAAVLALPPQDPSF